MTEIDLTALMEAIDAADKVVALKKSIRENIEIALRSAVQDEAIATAEAEGLHRALFLVTPQHDTAQLTATASEAAAAAAQPLADRGSSGAAKQAAE